MPARRPPAVLLAAPLTAWLAAPAQGALVDVDRPIEGSGSVTVVFAFKAAADRSQLWLGEELLFDNTVDAFGAVVTVEIAEGPLAFELRNLSRGYSFYAGVRDIDGAFHARSTGDFADFGVRGGLPADTATSLLREGDGFTFIGFEDRRFPRADGDFNDLIYAFRVNPAPEPAAIGGPAALGVVGLGLLGLGALRWRRWKAGGATPS